MSIVSIVLSLLVSTLTFALLFALWFIVTPYSFVHYYKKQGGGAGYFKPFLGFLQDRMMEVKTEGDFLYYFKKMASRSYKNKFIVSNIGSQAVLCLTDTELIKEFVNQPQQYCKARITTGLESFFESQGIVFREGEQWKKQRRSLAACFHNEFLKEQPILMSRMVNQAYSDLIKSGVFIDVNVSKLAKRLAGDLIGNAFFGNIYQKFTFDEQPMTLGILNLLSDAFDQVYSGWNLLVGTWFIRTGLLPQHRKIINRIQDLRNSLLFIIHDMKRRKTFEPNHTLLKTLFEQQQTVVENVMTDEEIVDNFISLFIAGANTTGSLVSATLNKIAQSPKIYEKVILEIEEKLGSGSQQQLNFEQTQKMEYLLAVIKESLRQNNPQGMLPFREATQDHQLHQDLKIKKGTLVTFSPLIACHDPKFFEKPLEFNPERWLSSQNKNSALKKEPFCYIPFSAGPKACLGQHFALIGAKVMLISFLRNFKMNLSPNSDFKMTHTQTYEPLEDITLDLVPIV